MHDDYSFLDQSINHQLKKVDWALILKLAVIFS